MCLTSDGKGQFAKIFYRSCSATDLNQEFVFKRLESDLFSSFGRLFSPANDNLCTEMDRGFDDQVFLHPYCWDTYQIMSNGALKNIEDGRCIGIDEADETKVTGVDCKAELAETWNPELFLPTMCEISNFNGYNLLASDNAHCYRLQFEGGVGLNSTFGQDAMNKDCTPPFQNDYPVGKLASISEEGVGFYSGGDYCDSIKSDRSATLRIFQASCTNTIELSVNEATSCRYDATIQVPNCDTVSGDWTNIKSLNHCVDLEDWKSSTNGMKVRLVTCSPAGTWSQHWKYDDLGRLVNRYNQKCLDAGRTGNLHVMDCNEEMHQRWKNDGGKYLNVAYSKYLGVANCGNTNSNEKWWLELQNDNSLTSNSTVTRCNEAQIFNHVAVNKDVLPRKYFCSDIGDKSDYRGKINVTEAGFQCQRWDSKEHYSPDKYPEAGLEENFCRNPDDSERAWCFSTNPNEQWEYCDVPSCIEERC